MPGSSTISDAMITVLRLSGAMKLATRMATKPATSAEIASLASFICGRRAISSPSTPMMTPISPAVAMSSHGSRHSPATAAAARPDAKICIARQRTLGVRSSARSAVWPWAMLISPIDTASAMRSASLSLCRSVSPGASRITRVLSLAPKGRTGSLKLRIRPVGFDHGSQSRPSRCESPTTVPSSRCAVVP